MKDEPKSDCDTDAFHQMVVNAVKQGLDDTLKDAGFDLTNGLYDKFFETLQNAHRDTWAEVKGGRLVLRLFLSPHLMANAEASFDFTLADWLLSHAVGADADELAAKLAAACKEIEIVAAELQEMNPKFVFKALQK